MMRFSLLSLVLVAACNQTAPQASTAQSIFNNDDRVSLGNTQSPWMAIGKLSSGCTATLIDRNKILTAKHCVYNFDTHAERRSLYFYPSYPLPDRSESATMVSATYPPGTNWVIADDWAVVTLDRNVGDEFGWVSVSRKSAASLVGKTVTQVGYSADVLDGEYPTAHFNCQIHNQRSRALLHDCDITPGASGGPLLAWNGFAYEIVGVQSGQVGAGTPLYPAYNDALANSAAATADVP